MQGSFHGRTMATLSATGQFKVQIGYDPLLEGFKFVPFNDLAALRNAVDDTVCAVMLEPIQGEGGIVVPHPDYLKGVKEICREKGALLIFDEIQTGMGRTGRLFAYEPIGAMLSTELLSSAFGPGSHASTFGGTPLVTAVSKAVLSSLLTDGWLEHCRNMGNYFMARLEELKKRHACIKEVRGLGLIIGVELDRPGAPVLEACVQRGFLINCAQEKVLRFVPPLVVTKKEIDQLIEALDAVLDGV
jgi:acetylornithine aminotransferase